MRAVKAEGLDVWTQSRLRLELTPDGPGSDVVLELEPMDCSYPHARDPQPDPRALCGWADTERGPGLGPITGLAERVRWTVRGIDAPPPAPANLVLETEEHVTQGGNGVVDSRTVLFASFDAAFEGSRWRVEVRAQGGDWSDARVFRGAKHGFRHRVRLEGVDPDGAWDVRARWENRYGAGPWADAAKTDAPPLAAPRNLRVAQGADGFSVRLVLEAAGVGRRPRRRATSTGWAGRRAPWPSGWRDIPDSGPGAANARSYTVHGLERTWEIRAQVRAVDRSGRAGDGLGGGRRCRRRRPGRWRRGCGWCPIRGRTAPTRSATPSTWRSG